MKNIQCESLIQRLIHRQVDIEEPVVGWMRPRKSTSKSNTPSIPHRFAWLVRQDPLRHRSYLLDRSYSHKFTTILSEMDKLTKQNCSYIPQESLTVGYPIERQHTYEQDFDFSSVLGEVNINIPNRKRGSRELIPSKHLERRHRQTRTTQSNRPKNHEESQLKFVEKHLDLPQPKMNETRYTPKSFKYCSKEPRYGYSLSKKSQAKMNLEWLLTQKMTIQRSKPESQQHRRNLTHLPRKIKSKAQKENYDLPIRPWYQLWYHEDIEFYEL